MSWDDIIGGLIWLATPLALTYGYPYLYQLFGN